MSDHEGEGLDLERWEEASLPGASVFSYAPPDAYIQGIGHGNGYYAPPQTPWAGQWQAPRPTPASLPLNPAPNGNPPPPDHPKKFVGFAKSNALDGRAEHRLERQTRSEKFEQLLRLADFHYEVEGVFLWPKELDMEEFEKVNAEPFRQLRSQFQCKIELQKDHVEHIEIAASSEQAVRQVMTRMLNLIKESVARKDQLTAVNLLHLPHFSMYRDRVGLQDKDPQTDSYLPTLHGQPAPSEIDWVQECRAVHASNRQKLKKAIDTLIRRLRVSEQHVLMRCVFGELGFVGFQKPAGGADSFAFKEFYNMVTGGRPKLSLNGLPVRQGDVAGLPDILDGMGSFHDRTEYYGAFFDFPSSSSGSPLALRLETVIDQFGEGQYQTRDQRWLELGDSVSRLQASVFNFERPDFQITIDAFPMYSMRQIKNLTMASFEKNVFFDPAPQADGSAPRRRVKYPREQRGLATVSELTNFKWRFKDTDGFFVLRRKDTYDERLGPENCRPIHTRWHALYYYPAWDNLLSEFAGVKAGQDVSWVKSVATFFPEGEADDGMALPQGFKNFINEVEEIQDLLAEAIGRLAKQA